ncbi:MAG: hypothetical protein PHF46_02735 [Candidatus Gracilibacteria bacterium]|nr:hypothetical protein [Candidatus Gracilibacteria bacterium]
MINLIDLNHTKQEFPLFSYELIEEINKNLGKNKKIILFFNKRGEANSLICKDCNYQLRCPNCDISFTVHKYPENRLICHHCNNKINIPACCPNCDGTNLAQIGIGTQKIEDQIKKLFGKYKILRTDSDKKNKEGLCLEDIKNAQIIITTEFINSISLENVGLVAFLLIEQEFVIPEYDIEEQIFDNIYYNIKRGSDVIIQTYIPDSKIVKLIIEGNYKNFLVETLKERKTYNYPPYKELVYIWVKNKNLTRVKDIIFKLKNKLDLANNGNYEIFFDKDIFSKKASEFQQKIVIKGNDLQEFLGTIKGEIFRNKEINVERK